jgi:hypothetical protein
MKKEDEDAVACVMDTLHGKLSTIGRDPCGGSLGLIQLFNLRALVSLLSTTSCYGFFLYFIFLLWFTTITTFLPALITLFLSYTVFGEVVIL